MVWCVSHLNMRLDGRHDRVTLRLQRGGAGRLLRRRDLWIMGKVD